MLSDEQKKHLDEQGYVFLEEFLADDEVEEIRALVLELAEKDLREGRDYTYLDGARRVCRPGPSLVFSAFLILGRQTSTSERRLKAMNV